MMDGLLARGATLGAARADALKLRLMAALPVELPKGVSVESAPRGIILTGKRLRMRFITDPRLRAIAALAQGLVR